MVGMLESWRNEMARHRATFCNHYRAMSDHDTCAAGVPYSKFDGMAFGKRPCFRKDRNESVRCGCDLVQFPTDAELDAAENEMLERFNKIASARRAIVDACGGPWKRGAAGAGGVIDCPACGGTKSLRYSRAGYNGHVHASCSTPGCVKWME